MLKKWRGEFVTNLIKDLDFKNYLELGVASGNCWNNVTAPEKIGVDLMNDTMWKIPDVITKSTDEYFQSLSEDKKFDIIFIDPPFKETKINQILENLLTSNLLAEKRLIIFHRHKNEKVEITKKLDIFEIRTYGISKIFFGC